MSSPERLYKAAKELGYVGAPLLDFMFDIERALYADKLDEKLEITKTVSELVRCVDSINNAEPGSEYARAVITNAYELLDKRVKPLLETLKLYKTWNDKFWSGDTDKVFDQYVKKLVSATEEPLATAIKDIGYERRLMDNMYTAGRLSNAPSKKKAQEPAADAAAKVVGMVVVLAFGFAMLNGLNSMRAGSSAGAAPSLNTGFFLLPGIVYVTSLQMVLFMLVSAVAVMYLAGKALGEW